jgi:hypothetical protein
LPLDVEGRALAGVLPPRDYEVVAHAFARAADLERGFQALLRVGSMQKGLTSGGMEVVPLSAEIKPTAEKLLAQAQTACELLGGIAYEGDELPSDMESHRDPTRP